MSIGPTQDENAAAVWPVGDEERGRLGTVLGRWLPLALGLLAFELTANPMLGIAVACIKFGWEDFRTALWLRRTDPERSRGRACAWFHAALGFGKLAAMGIVGTIVVVAISMLWAEFAGNPLPNDLINQEAKGALWTALASGLLSLLTAYMAIGTALVGGIRAWIGPEAARARRDGLWPPSPSDPAAVRRNPALIVPHFAMILTVIGLLIAIFGAAIDAGRLLETVATVVTVGVIGGVILFCWFAQWLGSRIVADHPFECWPEAQAVRESIGRPCR